jgi:hypothetical protein
MVKLEQIRNGLIPMQPWHPTPVFGFEDCFFRVSDLIPAYGHPEE